MAHLPSRSGFLTAPVPAIVQAPPTLNNASSDVIAQSPAYSALPTSAHVPDRSSTHAATVVTILTPVGNDSCLVSFLGPNVAIHVCRHKCFLTISPANSRSGGLIDRVVTTLEGHLLEVISVSTIILRDNARVYSLQCQAAGRNVELLRNDLYTALRSIVNDFATLP